MSRSMEDDDAAAGGGAAAPASLGRDLRVSSVPSGTKALFMAGELFLVQRARGILGKQGDHDSSLGMVIRGITRLYRAFAGELIPDDIDPTRPVREDSHGVRYRNFFDLEISMKRRKQVLRFVTRLGSLDPVPVDQNENLRNFISELEAIFERYKKHRITRPQLEIQLALAKDESVRAVYIEKQEEKLKDILGKEGGKDKKIAEIQQVFMVDDETEVADLRTFLHGCIPDSGTVPGEEILKMVKAISAEIERIQADYAAVHMKTAELARKGTAVFLNEQASAIAAAVVNYYNRLRVSYNALPKEAKLTPNNKNSERFALERLDKHFHWIRPSRDLLEAEAPEIEEEDNPAVVTRWADVVSGDIRPIPLDPLMDQICALLDYWKIKDECLVPESDRKLGDRTNDYNQLTSVMAKHLFLFLLCYPEVALEYKCDLESEQPEYENLMPIMDKFGEVVFAKWQIEKGAIEGLSLDYMRKFNDLALGRGSSAAPVIAKTINKLGVTPLKAIQEEHEPEVDPSHNPRGQAVGVSPLSILRSDSEAGADPQTPVARRGMSPSHNDGETE